MRTVYPPFALILLAAVTIGCSGSNVSELASSASRGTGLAAAIPTLPSPEKQSEPEPASDETPVDSVIDQTEATTPPLPESMDLFSPPTVVIPVVTKEPELKTEPEPEVVEEPVEEERETTPPPPLRLLGFVEVDGLKALLTVEGKLNVVTIGDSVSGVEIIAVEAPTVTLRHGTEEFQMNLFEQEWFHAASPTGPLTGRQRTFGGKQVRASGQSQGGFPGGMPALPGMSQQRDGQEVIPEMPGFPGSENEGGLSNFGGDADEGGFPALPGFGDDDGEGGLPGLPDLEEGEEGGLPGLPSFDGEEGGDLP